MPGKTDQPLRVGLAGLGTMGRNHLRNVLARDDVTLVGVADPSVPALDAALGTAGAQVRGFAEASQMLAEETLDALIVAAPTTLHFPVAMAAVIAGVAVLVEKPIAATVDEGRQLADAADAHGTLLMVGHIERFNPSVQALAHRLRDGALSQIYSVKTVRGGPLPERIRDVGVAIDLASHDLDIMCHLLGEQPVRAYAEGSRMVHTAHEDLLYALLTFPSGVVGLMDVNWLTPEKQRRVTVLGKEGMFQVDYLSQRLTFTRGSASLAPEYLDGYAPMFAGETITLPVKPGEPLRRELDAFFAAVRSNGPSPVSGQDGLTALRLVNALLVSAAEGRAVEVSLAGVS